MYILIYGIIIIFVVLSVVPVSSGLLASLGLICSVILIIAVLKRNANLADKCTDKYPKNMLIIQNVKEGGVLKIANVEGYDEDLELKVIGKNLYTEGDYSWFELECIRPDGEKVWIDVDDDDDLVVSIVIKKLNCADITYSATLEQIDENETGYVTYKQLNKKYHYIDSGKAVFYKHCDDLKSESLQYWDFRNNNNLISIEKWNSSTENNAQFEYFYSQIIKPYSITVYSTGNEGN